MKSLSFNLMMARLACVHIRRAIASSTNLTGVHRPMLLDRSRIASDEKRQLRQRNESWFAEYDNQLLEQHQLSSTWRVPRSFRLSQMRFHAALAMKSGVGNCGEMSAAAFLFLAQSNLFPLDLLHVNYRSPAQFGHAFLVIGRDGDVSLAEPWNWGESAVVCDPWNNAVFPVTAYHYYAHYFPQSFRHLMVNQLVRLESSDDEKNHADQLPGSIKAVQWPTIPELD
ncbi:hypothetical protein [Pelagibaculum spongiae]|uniref:Uncharacterized protein n=1 Tax=Pelagibaculum spongiae TaxID=2080658 RepID=A0A2V1H2B2_9GAMM|nr:hypothetical protein [Pelagibaculum spongiae]PVZ70521.1 hypothetical protein DC094_08035 [Pelagibaculum spongiae]